MKDAKGILAEYLPLTFKMLERVNFSEDEIASLDESDLDNSNLTGIGYAHFEWVLDKERREGSYSSLYDGSPQVLCGYERESRYLKALLKGELFRLPMAVACFGDQSLMLHSVLAQTLEFDPRLGVVASDATLIDATLTPRPGFTALSFHKSLSAARIEQRFADVPAQQRPVLHIKLYTQWSSAFLIHRDVLAQWQALDIPGIDYSVAQSEPSLEVFLKNEDRFEVSFGDYYYTLADYQAVRSSHPDVIAALEKSDAASRALVEQGFSVVTDANIPAEIDRCFEAFGAYDDPYFLLYACERRDWLLGLLQDDGLNGEYFALEDNYVLAITALERSNVESQVHSILSAAQGEGEVIHCVVYHHNCLGAPWETLDEVRELMATLIDEGESRLAYNDFTAPNWPGLGKYLAAPVS
ncbi:MAG: hypothetical protein ACPG4U_04965 [Pseudomonadales bacterium]